MSHFSSFLSRLFGFPPSPGDRPSWAQPDSGTRPESLIESARGQGWIGVDLDGTLAHYDGWEGIDVIGAPIPPMVERVKAWLAEGTEVRIFTARVSGPTQLRQIATEAIEDWCREYIGQVLAVTATKDFGMYELWDDRAVQVECNTGRRMDSKPETQWTP